MLVSDMPGDGDGQRIQLDAPILVAEPRPPLHVVARVHCDTHQLRAHAALSAESREALVRLQKRLLNGVLREMRIPQK